MGPNLVERLKLLQIYSKIEKIRYKNFKSRKHCTEVVKVIRREPVKSHT